MTVTLFSKCLNFAGFLQRNIKLFRTKLYAAAESSQSYISTKYLPHDSCPFQNQPIIVHCAVYQNTCLRESALLLYKICNRKVIIFFLTLITIIIKRNQNNLQNAVIPSLFLFHVHGCYKFRQQHVIIREHQISF
jgi:hypothetical protein